jgi:CHASE3 domain sensor protein
MNKSALSLLLVLSMYFLAAPASWAQQQQTPQNTQAPRLYQQCQDRLKKDPKNVEAKELCDEGMKLHREGKQEEAIKTIQEGLAKFKE